MKRESARRVEEMLRNGAVSARRDPPPALRARITSAVQSGSSPAQRAPTTPAERASLARPAGWRAWRGGLQDALVAAAVLAAIGVWGFAFLRESPNGAHPSSLGNAVADDTLESTLENGFLPIEGSAAPEVIVQVARATPRTLHTAIDGSLFAELGNIAQDATRAAHFLVGRLPAPLVTRAIEDAPH